MNQKDLRTGRFPRAEVLRLDFAALNGRNRVFNGAVAERDGAHGFGPAADFIFVQIDVALAALGGDVHLCAG